MTERGELRLIPATAEDAEDLTVLQAVTFFDDRKRMPSEHIAPESPVEGPDGCRSVEWNRRVIENPRTRYYKGHDLAPIQFGFDHHIPVCSRRELNPSSAGYQPTVLPLNYRSICHRAARVGIEPTTLRLTAGRIA